MIVLCHAWGFVSVFLQTRGLFGSYFRPSYCRTSRDPTTVWPVRNLIPTLTRMTQVRERHD